MNFKFLTTKMESAQKLTSRCGLQNSLGQTVSRLWIFDKEKRKKYLGYETFVFLKSYIIYA